MNIKGPKILIVDIETIPIEAYAWALWGIDISLSQIKKDWSLLSFAAKWVGSDKIIYYDQQERKDIRNDKFLCKKLWDLLDEADIVVGQNSEAFDVKKIFARMVINGMNPPSTFKQIDTKKIATKYFGFTSNKLEYLSNNLSTNHKKMIKREFDGMHLWTECIKRNPKAFAEMKKYNIKDVLATEEVYNKLLPWDHSISFHPYQNDEELSCTCGSQRLEKKGFAYTTSGKFQRYRCVGCGKNSRGKINLLSSRTKKNMKSGIPK